MIIDAHVHLPIGKDCNILCRKREKLLQELARNHIDGCIVISDSCMESDIGNLNECVELSGCNQEEHIQFVKKLKLNARLTEAVFAGNAKCLFRLE